MVVISLEIPKELLGGEAHFIEGTDELCFVFQPGRFVAGCRDLIGLGVDARPLHGDVKLVEVRSQLFGEAAVAEGSVPVHAFLGVLAAEAVGHHFALRVFPQWGSAPCECEALTPDIIEIRLGDGKARLIDSMFATSFYSPGGNIISAREFLEELYGELPTIFRSEAELQQLWAQPATRRALLDQLEERGYAEAQLQSLRQLVNGQQSDLYDVLAHVAYSKELIPRSSRAARALERVANYNPARADFLRFVLDQYVREGYQELDDTRLAGLLELKYGGLTDAKKALGSVGTIRKDFIGVQGALYE